MQAGLRTGAKFEHQRLQARLEHLAAFRKQHEQLRQVIGRVLKEGSSGMSGMLGLLSAKLLPRRRERES